MANQVDFNSLAEEAAQTAYEPRAKKCWPWSHEWTMWQIGKDPILPALYFAQSRRCVRCGKNVLKRL